MAEFTGERVIPGKVDTDLWNEHFSRYLFASRLCRSKKVIDLGCGSGYGSAELATKAASVTGVDISVDAIAEAAQQYTNPNLQFQTASLAQLPFADATFQLGVCFEVIEHLSDYRALLSEARRVLVPEGQLIISTPNVEYYAESRKLEGPNPFHAHEFSYEEFRSVLAEFFDYQTFFVQNHSSGIVFLPLAGTASSELRLETNKPNPEEAHFFIAVCSARPMTGGPAFVYMPTAANVLREREHHIQRLEAELVTKNQWLETARNKHKTLVDQFRSLQQELEEKNQWALRQNEAIAEAGAHIERLEGELASEIASAKAIFETYEAKLTEADNSLRRQVEWANSQETALNAHIVKLDGEIAELQTQVTERTQWAQNEQATREAVEAKLAAVEASRWIRMGKAFGLGPKF